jgi:hypothetical protein
MSQAESTQVDLLLKKVQLVAASLFACGAIFLLGYAFTH